MSCGWNPLGSATRTAHSAPDLSRRKAPNDYGRLHGMTITMDAAGRIVIPREIRREAGLQPDTPLDVRWRDGVIEIEPQPLSVNLERRGGLLVAKPRVKVEPLRADVVERTRRRINER
jgi:AbrB family looped-hinge helix DNA binding protein